MIGYATVYSRYQQTRTSQLTYYLDPSSPKVKIKPSAYKTVIVRSFRSSKISVIDFTIRTDLVIKLLFRD
ncbi:hypothetical protein QVD17_17549 [Tagetes erecta]|uniref:Uncharacterized protein n=1 Tax=Tagetes erecta TaxID=13708 RepID=A0AAD8KZP7_TARER|nr:hypothetical protein QVD17_17549 [Tagetes erecta]